MQDEDAGQNFLACSSDVSDDDNEIFYDASPPMSPGWLNGAPTLLSSGVCHVNNARW
jgi:hypothetical protein